MNIKVAAFTVSEKSSNISPLFLGLTTYSLHAQHCFDVGERADHGLVVTRQEIQVVSHHGSCLTLLTHLEYTCL